MVGESDNSMNLRKYLPDGELLYDEGANDIGGGMDVLIDGLVTDVSDIL